MAPSFIYEPQWWHPDYAPAFQREIANSPQHLQSYANLALVYFIEENPHAADDVLRDMVRKNPHRGARALAAKTRAAFSR